MVLINFLKLMLEETIIKILNDQTEIFLLFRKRFKAKTGPAQFKFTVIFRFRSYFRFLEVIWGQFWPIFAENTVYHADFCSYR